MRHLTALTLIAILTSPLGALAQTTAPSPEDSTLSPMRGTEFSPQRFLYVTGQVNYADSAAIAKMIQQVAKAMEANHIAPSGGPVVLCHGATRDPNHVFTMDIGFPVRDNTPAVGECKVTELAPFQCASAVYTGAPARVGDALHELYRQTRDAGHVSADRLRIRSLYYEGDDSANNVFLLEIEL